ncbi:unnamed protein product [Adineta steineri]|uniref:Uncharacterized protein n=1 Tax=Adineta steineri TaxID=433720 RepID=A0A814GLX6_9BILA|nr:unnamed protein product [Adineta steineri]CAF1110551.1 unnamed protein product [Adineta steineri]
MNYQCRSTKIPVKTCTTICDCQLSSVPMKQRFIEPIFQAYVKKPDSKPLHCLSNKCDTCLSEYFDKRLQGSYKQIFHEQKDTLEMARPTAIVSSPSITLTDNQMMVMQDEAIGKLQEDKKEIRKRYALMQMDDGVFILGGYIVDNETGEKRAPKRDYFYNNTSKELISIPPLPGNGRMGFGLAATDDNKIIVAGGHNFDYEPMSNVTMLDTQTNNFKWENLPDMYNGTIGPGVSVIDNILYVIGGFDFIEHDILCNGDVLLLDLEKKQWKTLPDIDPPRARPLISIVDNTDPPVLVIAGGYNFNKQGKAAPHGKIEEYNIKKKQWEVIGDIPNFKTTNGLATKNNKLFLMETSFETGENRVIKEYNLETHKWESSHNIKQSSDHHIEKNKSRTKSEHERHLS